MVISKIKWVTDGYDTELPNLPNEVEVSGCYSDDEICEYLAEKYGFPVKEYSRDYFDGEVDEFGQYVNEVEGKVS